MAHEIYFLISHQELIQQCAFCVCRCIHEATIITAYNHKWITFNQTNMSSSFCVVLITLNQIRRFHRHSSIKKSLHYLCHVLPIPLVCDVLNCVAQNVSFVTIWRCVMVKVVFFCCCCSCFIYVYIPCVSSKSIWMKTPACPRKHAQQLLKMWDNIMKYPKIRTLHEKKTDGEMMRSEGGKIALIFISHTQQIKNTIVIHSLSLIRSLP